ncbi:MAG: 1-deoxy-D-xylulose-5-phosphate reductoisomerase [Chlamydiae bacterium]|nr:1-deoxy-D-xylulose-5-phosphate reductoisomerase [Chlamydiota bacterium]
MKRIVILGSTGSIGTQTLDIVRHHPDKFKVIGLSANSNMEKLKEQIEEFRPEAVCITDMNKAESFKTNATLYKGEEGLKKIATLDSDLVINSLVGTAGLIPTLEAIKKGITIGLANKETLVLAGEIVIREAKKNNVTIIPIDSEHSALFQSLKSGKKTEIRNIYLTMGKGKIAEMSEEQLKNVTMKDIFSRPAWNMGNKITIDSATCINKAFEIIEAKWLFDVDPSQIKVVVHPEYICHSLVEFSDGSIITELGTPDMRRYTQYALFYPERAQGSLSSFTDLYGKTLNFEKPAFAKFPCLNMGYTVLEMGGIMPAVLHGADHTAVQAYMENKIGFMDIPKIIAATIQKTKNIMNPDINQIIEAETVAQKTAMEILENDFCSYNSSRELDAVW